MTAQLRMVLKLAAQQTRGIIRYAAQPLLGGQSLLITLLRRRCLPSLLLLLCFGPLLLAGLGLPVFGLAAFILGLLLFRWRGLWLCFIRAVRLLSLTLPLLFLLLLWALLLLLAILLLLLAVLLLLLAVLLLLLVVLLLLSVLLLLATLLLLLLLL